MVDLAAQRERLGERVEQAIGRVLDHGRFVDGPEVVALEEALARHCGAAQVIGCASGTDALVLALMALGVGAGDAVFVPSFTFAATAEAVLLCGATPVFVDVDETSFNVAPPALVAAVEQVAASGRLRPRAVLPVDLFGQPADYDAIGEVAGRHDLLVVADGAQSYGATWRGRAVGTLAPVTTTSFFPSKPLGGYGDGGAVLVADDDELAGVLRSLRSHGQGAVRYEHVRLGFNGRLDTIQAAVLLEKLAIFDDELKARAQVAERYAAAFADALLVPVLHPAATSSWAQYTLVLDDRDAVAAELAYVGVASAVHYPKPLHRQPAFESVPVGPGGTPVSERLAESVLSLPMHAYLDEATQDRVIAAVLGALR
jgi:dTDP-4-amino-4,6-dideoxygalactose transaminase